MDKVKRDYLVQQGRATKHFFKFGTKDIHDIQPGAHEDDKEKADYLWLCVKIAVDTCDDRFKPSAATLFSWMHNARSYATPEIIHLWGQMSMKRRVAHALQTGGQLDVRQICNTNKSIVDTCARLAQLGLAKYIEVARTAHLACQDLLADTVPVRPEAARPQQDSDDELCICCLSECRSLVYRPCGHRVCCEQCAVALWARSQICPWCREPCQDVRS